MNRVNFKAGNVSSSRSAEAERPAEPSARPEGDESRPLSERIPSVETDLKRIFRASVCDVFDHHNQALDAFDVARDSGQIAAGQPYTLVHVDTHADAYGVRDRTEGIGNYINRLMQDGSVDTVYWVLPDEAFDAGNAQHFFSEDKRYRQNMSQAEPDVTLLVNPTDGSVAFASDIAPADLEGYKGWRKIDFHKVRASTLPDLEGKNVWLDIDADYFANRGMDTNGGVVIHSKGEEGFISFLDALKKARLEPKLTTCALSPDYTSAPAAPGIKRFLWDIAHHSKVEDLLVAYHHDVESPSGENQHSGINVARQESPNTLGLMAQLEGRVDVATEYPNAVIPLDDSPEGRAALEVTAKHLGVATEEAGEALRRLDSLDGRTDGAVDLQTIGWRLQTGKLAAHSLEILDASPAKAPGGTSTGSGDGVAASPAKAPGGRPIPSNPEFDEFVRRFKAKAVWLNADGSKGLMVKECFVDDGSGRLNLDPFLRQQNFFFDLTQGRAYQLKSMGSSGSETDYRERFDEGFAIEREGNRLTATLRDGTRINLSLSSAAREVEEKVAYESLPQVRVSF